VTLCAQRVWLAWTCSTICSSARCIAPCILTLALLCARPDRENGARRDVILPEPDPAMCACGGQARRLEAQLYQRAQDQRTIEMAQRQAQLARVQVHQLEQHHLEQAARISQGAKTLHRMQELIRESLSASNSAIGLCESLERDVKTLRDALGQDAPHEAAKAGASSTVSDACESLKGRAQELEVALAEMERSALQQIGATPPQSVAMSRDCNPLHDLSAVADYAPKASIAGFGGDLQPATEMPVQASLRAASSAPSMLPPNQATAFGPGSSPLLPGSLHTMGHS
jgi:hypothetical protein